MSTTTLAKPWENMNGTPPSSPVTPGTEQMVARSPTTGNVNSPAFPVVSSPTTTATTAGTVAAVVPQNSTGTSSSHQVASTNNLTDYSNQYASSYGSGMGYGGLGSTYGGLGMGSMYGGLGMGGMYGGLGMGGMYGGLGMGGMYGMGMGMGLPEDFQRSQMTFMLVGRLLEMCGMFAGVIQMTFGSALQFMGNYIGMSQQYNQLKCGRYKDENGQWVQVPQRITGGKSGLRTSHGRRSLKRKEKGRGKWFAILRRLAFLILAVLLAKKLTGWWAARQLSRLHGPK
ncbi:uncharacterized protein TM35_000041690 [Trypanosoma theileri]|uniref:Peroxin-13 n=1 Tax=Trypanosoma theileri TaxID=67003 RepID=A0A1X0P507_9TRYP|nr:uncharacterized protein TM35_000041690 [Trypanosoma theileri]ORC91955.1 hypothetical protein TM35_000041690 [Trypanosoma theileri]